MSTEHKLTKAEVKAYQRELRRQGFALRYRDRSRINGNMWTYHRSYATPNRLGTATEYREIEVQLCDIGCRVSHMVSRDIEHRFGQGTTTPTSFTTIGEMVLAIALEVSRYDHFRHGIEYQGACRRPIVWIIDKDGIVRVTTVMLNEREDEPLTYDGLPVKYETTPVVDPHSGLTFNIANYPLKSILADPFPPGPVSGPNSKRSERYAYCDACKRRRPMLTLSASGPVYMCNDIEACYQSQRRQGFIHGT